MVEPFQLRHGAARCHDAHTAAAQTKRLVSRLEVPESLAAHLRDELTLAAQALKSDDGREARRALREQRKPVFSGR